MAHVVLGIGTPHAPQLRINFEGWLTLRDKDVATRKFDYNELLARVKPDIEMEITEERMRQRYDAVKANLRALGKTLEEARPDVIVMVGDDQREQFHDDNMPMFCIYRGSSIRLVRRHHGGGGSARRYREPRFETIPAEIVKQLEASPERPAESGLAEQMIETLRNDGFDIAVSNSLNPEVGIGHAFRFLYEHLLPGTDIPLVPVMLNSCFPPNQPAPKRCYALGQALRKAIQVWGSDKRVAVVASGGLSHTIIDEKLDDAVIQGIRNRDGNALRSLPLPCVNLGTAEIRNWVAVAGALEDMAPHFIGDYIPAYRSPAGTGCGIAFAYWTPA